MREGRSILTFTFHVRALGKPIEREQGQLTMETGDRAKNTLIRCSGTVLSHCQVLASLKRAAASRELRVAISLGV